MNDMTTAQAAQQNNRDNGGKYTTKAVGESEASLEDAARVAEVRCSAAKAVWEDANVEAYAASLDAVRAEIVAIYPDTKYIAFECSDQGDYAAIREVYDAEGNPAVDRDGNGIDYGDIESAEEHAGWLSMDNPHHWEDEHLESGDLPGDLSELNRRGVVIIDATTGTDPDPDATNERANSARDAWHRANNEMNVQTIESIRASILAERPDAAYIVIGTSDQGDYGTLDGVFDADGNLVLDEEEVESIDEAYYGVGMLSVDNPHAWEQFQIDVPEALRNETIASGSYVIETR